MKTLAIVVVVLALFAVAAVVLADPPVQGYGSQPGYEVSAEQTECQGHGSFGAFGAHGDIVHDFGVNNLGSNGEPGANGYQTGLNNSGLCGNRQSP